MIYDVLVQENVYMIVRVEADCGNEARRKARDAAEPRLRTEGHDVGMTTAFVDVNEEPPYHRAGIDLDTTRKEEPE